MTDTGTIVVRRPSGGYRDLLRAYRLEVDGVEAGRVRRGEQLELPVPAGRRNVRALIDWTGSPAVEVDVPAGGLVMLTVSPGGTPLNGFRQMLRRDSYLRLTADR